MFGAVISYKKYNKTKNVQNAFYHGITECKGDTNSNWKSNSQNRNVIETEHEHNNDGYLCSYGQYPVVCQLRQRLVRHFFDLNTGRNSCKP